MYLILEDENNISHKKKKTKGNIWIQPERLLPKAEFLAQLNHLDLHYGEALAVISQNQ
uniref:Glutamyl-tRNA amidotransferase subunit Bic/mitochondrial-like n=1 Tax=Rhizophora mucronata TaxID=61149 RepID=A0A2P2L1D6_RHIMU